MGIKLKHAGTISGGSGRSKNGPQMNDASRVDAGGHLLSAPATPGRTSAPGGGAGGNAPLVSAPNGAHLVQAHSSGLGGRGSVGGSSGPAGIRTGVGGSKTSSSLTGKKNGGVTSYSTKTAPLPVRPDPDFQVTGYDPKVQPDPYSVWNPQTAQWERGKVAYQNWLGGMGDERKFTEAQRREAEQLNAVYERARKSGRYTPEELAQIREQIEARKAGIQPLSQLPQPSAQDQFNESIVTDPQTGNRYRRDAKGNYVPMEGGGVTPEMWSKWYDYESKLQVTDGNGVVRERTPEEVSAAMKAREAEFMSRFGPKQPTEEPGVTDVTNSPRGTGTITTADGRTVSTGAPPARGTITITQNGKTTTTTVDDIMRDPKMIKNLKEHWASGAGMNPEAKPAPSAAEPSPVESPAEAPASAGEQKPKRGLLLLDQGQLPDYVRNRSGGDDSSGGGEESASPPKKEKKDDE